MHQQRPTIVSVLAVMDCLLAAFGFAVIVICLLPASARTAASEALDRFVRSDNLNSTWSPLATASNNVSSTWSPLATAVAGLLIALLYSFLAAGLWKLRNWARIATLVFTLPISGALPSALGLFNVFFPVPGFALAGYALSFLLFLYLVNPKVRTAFGVTPPRKKWLIPAVSVVAIASLSYDLYRSGREFQAIRWHMRSGDRVRVNGVAFPVYYWYTPIQDCVGADFTIEDRPGPLRKRDAFGAYIEVKRASPSESVNVEKQVEEKEQGLERAGYKVTRFPMRVSKETLSCLSSEGPVIHMIDCYGEGPIGSVVFSGGNRSLDRFQSMMARAE
jgi:hypothetical protein